MIQLEITTLDISARRAFARKHHFLMAHSGG